MIKQFTQGYGGMNQDISLSKTDNGKYWSARNIRITSTDQPSTFSITNEHGNESVLSIPIPTLNTDNTSIDYVVGSITKSLSYKTTNNNAVPPRCQLEEEYNGKTSGTQNIIAIEEARDSVIIITTDDAGWDCVWEFTDINSGVYGLTLIYMNNLALSSDTPIQIIYNYENSIIEKIYFVDGVNQLRFMNLRQSEANGDLINLADMEPSSIDTVSNFDLSQPTIQDIVGGGSHTSGMIQYAYGLYVLNGSQTTISPLSQLKPIDKGNGLGGGEINEKLGKAVILNIPNIDVNYTHIKIYSIKYTSFNQSPEVSVVADKEIDNYNTLTFYDNGSILYNITLAQFLFLGSAPKIPKHIATKDSRMFLINIKEKHFDVDLDMRAYAHTSGGSCIVIENLSSSNGRITGNSFTVNTTTYAVPLKHDAITNNYDTYKYQKDGSTRGGEGLHVKVELYQSDLPNAEDLKFFKDRELYRLGIEFYNGRGQISNPTWIMDFLSTEGNLEDNYNQLKVELKPAFYTWLNDSDNFADEYAKPIGYRILRADRQLIDRTIIAQGILNPTISNYRHTDKSTILSERKADAEDNSANKMPSLLRTFQDEAPVLGCKNYHLLDWNSANDTDKYDFGVGSDREVYNSQSTSKDWKAQTYQFSKLMMMYSPEISFSDVLLDSSLQMRVKGMHKQGDVNLWSSERHIVSALEVNEAKFKGGLNYRTATVETIKEDPLFLNDFGLWGASNAKDKTGFNQIERDMTGGFIKNTNSSIYDISGTPELAERGADFTAYNGNHKLRYANHLKTLHQDDFRNNKDHYHEDAQTQVVGSNTYGERCVVIMEGLDLDNATPIEDIKGRTSISETNGVLLVELRKSNDQLYLGASYGGNSYESKSISSYISIGDYTPIETDNIYIQSPGDTFVYPFSFIKMSKTDVELKDRSMTQMTEIVTFPVETAIDLKNRNDLSLEAWDNRYQPKYDEYMNYNTVYSQSATLVRTTDPGFKFKQVSEFDTRLIASKQKIAGENIDSWTDYLENEQIDMDGKYGPINGAINFRDEIYTFQDSGVAKIAINPRVQTTGSEGLAIELGTGQVLHDYHYLTTVSGALNKWGIKSTDRGFYYFDLMNKSIMRGNSQSIENISDREGLHQHLVNSVNFLELLGDNPLKNRGIVIGYNNVNKDVFFSFKQATDPFTLGFNEKPDAFISFHDFVPPFYINQGAKMMTVGPDGTSVWEHFKGEKCNFYGTYYPSNLVFNVRGDSYADFTFNNIMFKSEMTDNNGNELPTNTIDFIRCYNEYQDSGHRALTIGTNLKRRRRLWTAQIPRHAGSRDRIKSPWAFVEVTLTNASGDSIILHDITTSFTTY